MIKERARVRVQIDKDIADKVEIILELLGLTPTTAITMFYHRIASIGELPFNVDTEETTTVEERHTNDERKELS